MQDWNPLSEVTFPFPRFDIIPSSGLLQEDQVNRPFQNVVSCSKQHCRISLRKRFSIIFFLNDLNVRRPFKGTEWIACPYIEESSVFEPFSVIVQRNNRFRVAPDAFAHEIFAKPKLSEKE